MFASGQTRLIGAISTNGGGTDYATELRCGGGTDPANCCSLVSSSCSVSGGSGVVIFAISSPLVADGTRFGQRRLTYSAISFRNGSCREKQPGTF